MTAPLLLSLLSPTVAIAIAFWGFRRSTRADQLRAFFEIQQRYLDNEVRSGRGHIHRSIAGLETAEVAAIDPEVLSKVGYTLAVMNSIAIACEGRYVDQAMVRRAMGRSFSAAMRAAEPYIDYVERDRGFRPYSYAERLGSSLALERY